MTCSVCGKRIEGQAFVSVDVVVAGPPHQKRRFTGIIWHPGCAALDDHLRAFLESECRAVERQ